MAGKRATFEDFVHNVRVRTEVPKKKGETEKAYFERLRENYGCMSRFWLQTLDKAIKAVGNTDDLQLLYEKFKEIQRDQNPRKKEKKKQVVELVYDPSIAEEYRREQEAKQAEEQVPGQMKMELEEQKPEQADQTKMMRFHAGQNEQLRKALTENTMELLKELAESTTTLVQSISDSAVMLNTKLDRLNDTLCMILRAVRKE